MASRVYPYLQSTRSRGFTLTPQQRAVGQVPWVQSPFFFSQYPRRFSMPKKQGSIRSPMTKDIQANPSHRTPSTEGTTEVMRGTAPKPAPISSPNRSEATVDTGRKSYNDQKRD